MSSGMQELRRAEEQATAEVEKARRDRVSRLKQAKAEAEKEIADFKAEQEAKFKAEQDEIEAKENEGYSITSQQRETDGQVAKMTLDAKTNADKICDLLVEVVTKVDMAIPEARRGVRAG